MLAGTPINDVLNWFTFRCSSQFIRVAHDDSNVLDEVTLSHMSLVAAFVSAHPSIISSRVVSDGVSLVEVGRNEELNKVFRNALTFNGISSRSFKIVFMCLSV